jgi:galactonate dehydratase
MRRGALWQDMYRSQYFEGGRVLTGAISAVDIALYDIAGKAQLSARCPLSADG